METCRQIYRVPNMRLKINGYPVTTRFMETDAVHPTPHMGIDYGLPMGTPVEALRDGTVTAITDEGSTSFGKAVHLHLDSGTDVIYGHLSAFKCRAGQHVHAGDVVGLSGSTGRSTGPHLHVQASQAGHIIDPAPLVAAADAGGKWLDRLNPARGLEEKLDVLNQKIDDFVYWINPIHWVQRWWEIVKDGMESGNADIFVCTFCIMGVMLWMIGMNWHKKYVFWVFVGYLGLKGFFF